MKVPKSPQDINKKWVEQILREHKASTDSPDSPTLLHVDSCTVNKDLGDGYNSQVVFFSAETTEKDQANATEVKKTYHLVAKLLHQDVQIQQLHKKFKTPMKEYLIYTELINNLNKILSEKAPEEPRISLPELIYGKCTSKDFILVMENIQYAGYEMNDKRKGLNGEQLKAAVDKIARIHAVSYVFHQTADISRYSCFPQTQEYMNTFAFLVEVMVDSCIAFLKSSKETEEIGKKIEVCRPSLFERSSTAMSAKYPVKCLVHGDYWNNNFMFKYTDTPDGQKVVEEVKVIDWGNCSWGTPMFDLQYLVHTSTNRSVRKDHLDEVLRHYHSTFIMLTTQLGSPLPSWGLEELKAEWEATYPFGFLFGCILTLSTLSTTNPANKQPEPSVLDKPLLLPIKVLADGIKVGLAKAFLPLFTSPAGKKIIVGFMKKTLKPLSEEFKSGKNEAMNTRFLDLIYEADENGLFTT